MGTVIAGAGMSVSLDGCINHTGGVKSLNPDYRELGQSSSFKRMLDNTGAVIMGRHVYDGMMDPFIWANDGYEFQTPIFVVTHTPPERYPQGNGKLSFTFVTAGIETAVAKAKEVAGDRDIQVLGANVTQQCLNAGLCDELQLNLVSVLVGDGLKLLDHLDTDNITLERTKVEEVTSMRTSITFKVTKN